MTGNDIPIAILASITSLIVAVISLIATITTVKQSSRSAKDLEKLRHDYSQADASLLFRDERLKDSLGSLNIALQSIQRMKDEIQLILSAFENSLDTNTALKRVIAARENLFDSYQESMAKMDSVESQQFHRAKNQAIDIENFLRSSLAGKEYVSLLRPQDKTVLREYRNELSDIQYTLRDRRSERLIQRKQHDDE